MKKLVAVTGAAGRLGRLVVRDFLKAGWGVVALCIEPPKQGFPKGVAVEIADLSDDSPEGVHKVASAFNGCDVVVHLAGLVDARKGWNEHYAGNVKTTLVSLEAAKQAGVYRFVYCSSTSVHRKARYLPIDEKHPVTPINDYGLSKALAEKKVRESGLAYVILRPAVIYGPSMVGNFVKFAKACKEGRMATIGHGGNRLGFVYEDDASRAFVLAATSRRALGHEFIIASGEKVTQAQAMAAFARMVGAKPPQRHVAKWMAYAGVHYSRLKHSIVGGSPSSTVEDVHTLGEERYYANAKAKRLLGWVPKTKFGQGLKRMAPAVLKAAAA